MSKQYRKINDLMKEAARILVGHGWRADRFEELFDLSRSSAFRLAKQAREEHSRQVVEQALRARREKMAQEAVKFKESWQREEPSVKHRGYSPDSNVRFRS